MPRDIEPGRLTLRSRVDASQGSDEPHRSPWRVPELVSEFRARLRTAAPEGPDLMDSRLLTVTLHMVHRDYGLSTAQVRTAMDQFFDHRLAKSYVNVSPVQHFLAFLKEYIYQQPDFRDVSALLDEGDT